MGIEKYKTWIFDCDGVLLNSNSVKTDAFYEVALPFGKGYAEKLVAYHRQYGGISRFVKFRYFFEHILGREDFKHELEESIEQYGQVVRSKLLHCAETEGVSSFLEKTSDAGCNFVVSGGMQEELRHVFSHRGLTGYFEGIYGSPDSKPEILSRLLSKGSVPSPAVFIGDSKYDYECANELDLDFIFMYQYSEFDGWQDFFKGKNVYIVLNLKELECQLTL